MKDKIVIIGLDGVPFDMIKDFADEGIMPNTARLISEGVFKKSNSTIPEISSVAWSSIITGKNPGEHGIYGFTDLHPDSYRLKFPNYNDLKSPPFWEQWPGKSVIMNVPSTYPVHPMNGIHVSGFVSIDINKSVYPQNIVDQLCDINYKLDVDSRKAHTSMHSFLEDLDNTLDARVAAYRYLWDDSIDWSTFMLVFTGTDRLMHFLWDAYENPKHKLNTAFSLHFGRIDKIIGEIMSKLSENNLVVMLSDHGFENLHRDVYVNHLLMDEGMLHLDGEKTQLQDINSKTKAFALDPGRIYLNYQDKYPNGSVSREESVGLLSELEDYFNNLKYNSRKVIKKVYRKSEIFEGDCLSDAPDLTLLAESEFNLKAALNTPKAFNKGIFTGKHTQDSAFMLFHGLRDESIVPETPNVQDMRWIIEKDRKIRYKSEQ
ncbi:MAG: alkaline phosphatase family protein [Sedimentisphaeraceae bacterium JB056]